MTANCRTCGKLLISNRRIYCPDCRHERDLAAKSKYYAKQRIIKHCEQCERLIPGTKKLHLCDACRLSNGIIIKETYELRRKLAFLRLNYPSEYEDVIGDMRAEEGDEFMDGVLLGIENLKPKRLRRNNDTSEHLEETGA